MQVEVWIWTLVVAIGLLAVRLRALWYRSPT